MLLNGWQVQAPLSSIWSCLDSQLPIHGANNTPLATCLASYPLGVSSTSQGSSCALLQTEPEHTCGCRRLTGAACPAPLPCCAGHRRDAACQTAAVLRWLRLRGQLQSAAPCTSVAALSGYCKAGSLGHDLVLISFNDDGSRAWPCSGYAAAPSSLV